MLYLYGVISSGTLIINITKPSEAAYAFNQAISNCWEYVVLAQLSLNCCYFSSDWSLIEIFKLDISSSVDWGRRLIAPQRKTTTPPPSVMMEPRPPHQPWHPDPHNGEKHEGIGGGCGGIFGLISEEHCMWPSGRGGVRSILMRHQTVSTCETVDRFVPMAHIEHMCTCMC